MTLKQKILKDFEDKIQYIKDAGFIVDYEAKDMLKSFLDSALEEVAKTAIQECGEVNKGRKWLEENF